MSTNLKSPQSARATKWADQLSKVIQHAETRHALPTATSSNPLEAELGKWLSRNVLKHKQGKMDPERSERMIQGHRLIARRLGGSRVDSRWESSLRQLVSFLETAKRRPSQQSADAHERFLGRWLNTQISFAKRGVNSPERNARLHRAHPEISKLLGQDTWEARWDQARQQLEDFVEQHDRLPSTTLGSGHETALARWLSTQKFAVRRGTLSERRLNELLGMRDLVVDYVHLPPAKNAWFKRLEELDIFVEANNALPQTTGAEEAEHRLACWLQRQASPSLVSKFSEEKMQAVRKCHPLIRQRILVGN